MNTFTDTPDLLRAILYAIEMHDGQRRKNEAAKPYVTHPISVALRLMRAGVTDTNVLCSAVLHDVVEDTNGTVADIETRFGPTVARIVGEVTDDKSLSVVERKKLQIEHAKTMSHEAKLVKLADKLDNCSEIATAPPATWSRERVEGYLVWTAGRAGEPVGHVADSRDAAEKHPQRFRARHADGRGETHDPRSAESQ
jgi:(p)ppGpp synthase/HD superfamily hydrolase